VKKLKTLHLNTERTWRGGEQQTLYLAQGLAARGHVARVCCQPDTEMSKRAAAAGLEVVELEMRGEFDVGAGWRIAKEARRERYDILHMHTSHAHGLAILARLFGRGPKDLRELLLGLRDVPVHVFAPGGCPRCPSCTDQMSMSRPDC